MSSVGRVSSEDEALVKKEKKEDDAKIFWQEINVDGLRYSDWLVTLGTLRKPELVPMMLLRIPFSEAC